MKTTTKTPTFEEFRQSCKRGTYRKLIASGEQIAADFISFCPESDSEEDYAELLDGEVLAYRFLSDDQANAFIDVLPEGHERGKFELDVGGSLHQVNDVSQLIVLEKKLYDWCVSEHDAGGM
jgi:hypothetical protein